MKKTNQELIDEYLANGGTISVYEVEEHIHEPIPKHLLIPTESHIYNRRGERVYKYLGKCMINASLDETTADYGK